MRISNKLIKCVILLWLLILGSGLHAVDVEFPLVQSIAYFPYSDHYTLGKGSFSLSLNMFYSNVYMYDYQRTTINDMEMSNNIIGFRYGLSNRVTAELYYKTTVAYGGVMDKLIIDFHKVFGFPEGGRYDYPRNLVNYQYKDIFSYDKNMLVQEPLVLGVVGNLYHAGNFTFNGRVAVGLPLASKPGFSSSKPFYTVGMISSYKTENGKFAVDFSNHISLFKKSGWFNKEDLRNYIFLANLQVNYWKLFCGLVYRSTPFKIGDLANDAYLIYVGFKFLKYFEFSMLEELSAMDTTSDVSFNLKIHIK